MTIQGDTNETAGLRPDYLGAPVEPALDFSVVSVVASDDKYQRMLTSFAAHGFGPDRAEFLAIDNRSGNRMDGFQALRSVAPRLRGRYVLLTHDDIELIGDGADALFSQLAALDAEDAAWMIAGNAGGQAGRSAPLALHIQDPHGSYADLTKPVPVVSLDENFLVMPRARMPLPSVDLDGFHLFATDMCLQARSAGGRAYVIPFLLRHHSGGTASPAFLQARARMEAKWTALGLQGRIRTPSTMLYFGWHGALARFVDGAEDFYNRQLTRARRVLTRFARPA